MVSSVGDMIMNWLLVLRHVTKMYCIRDFFLRLRRAVLLLETEGLAASQPVSKKLGGNPALSF